MLILSMLLCGVWAQETEQKNKFKNRIALSVTGGYQISSDLSILTYLKNWDNFKPSTSDFFGGVNASYIGNSYSLSVGFQSSYQDVNPKDTRTTLYTRILDIRGLWNAPFCSSLKIGGGLQKKIQELKVFSENPVNSSEPFLGVYAYSAYYVSPTIAYSIPLKEKIWLQITAQQAIPLDKPSWTNFQGNNVNGSAERQSTSRLFLELFYKL